MKFQNSLNIIILGCISIIKISFSSKDILEDQNTNEHFNPYLLNLTVTPLHYKLRLRPVLYDDSGGLLPLYKSPSDVTIKVESVKNGSDSITLHQRNLYIDLEHVSVISLDSGKKLNILTHTFELSRDLYTIKLQDSFKLGEKLQIYIPYTVNISLTENVGLYLGNYVDPETNKTRFLSTTKLEPYHARKVLPLFDEPSLKAKWSVIVGRLDDGRYHSLSNMEIEKVEPDTEHNGWVWDHYQETVLMPPYLVCVIVSDFANETVYLPDSKKRVTTWAPKHFISRGGGTYGVEKAAELLSFFENKFKLSYPLNKLDAVALPQFPSGATENFGVVTYRHKNLIWIPGENTEAQRRKITQVLSHEISHMWYGNVVTCAWWSEIWLNEGFARYLQFWGMQETIPEFKVEEAFVNDVVQLAMSYDESTLTHPLKNTAHSPKESSAVFDRISYEKGAAMLKMMEGFLSRDVFETGIIDVYLQRMKWRSAYDHDLFDALQDALEMHEVEHLLPDGITVKDIMTPWTTQSGYPLIKIKAVDQWTISISQEKLSSNKNKTSSMKWWVPVRIISSTDEGTPINIRTFWLPKNVSSVRFSSSDLNTGTRWIMVNPNATGYYRVLYDPQLTEMIRQQLLRDHTMISSSSRSQLFDDYFKLASVGCIPTQTALGLMEYLGNEIESNVWKPVLTKLKQWHWMFREQDEENLGLFKNYFLPRIEQALERIGPEQFENDKGINVTLRYHLYEFACQLDSPLCSDYASELLEEWESNPEINPFPLDLQPVLYCPAVAARSLKSKHSLGWNLMLQKYLKSELDTEKTLLARVLTCTRNLTDLENILEMSIISDSRKYFVPQHQHQILQSVVVYPPARSMVYGFIKKAFMMGKLSANKVAESLVVLSRKSVDEAESKQILDEVLSKRFDRLLEEYETKFAKNATNNDNGGHSTAYLKQILKELREISGTLCNGCWSRLDMTGREILAWLAEQENKNQY